MVISVINVLNWIVLWYFILLSLGYIILLLVSIPDISVRFKELSVGNIIAFMQSHSLPPVTVIISAYNEEKNIIETVESIINNVYPNIFIIIVNAGSNDQTLETLIRNYELKPVTALLQNKLKTLESPRGYYISNAYRRNIVVIDKALRDKSDALNLGINACQTPLFMSVDADTLVETDAISMMVYYLLSQPYVAAVGGAVYILNGCTFINGQVVASKMSWRPLHAFQTCEYLRSFLFSRSGWNVFGGALCYSGAFTLFRQHEIIDIGGFDVGNHSQDFEIITHLAAYKYENKATYTIGYTPSAASWTDVPSGLKAYWQQRFSWQYYTLRSLFTHIQMLFNPKYGIFGMFTFPFYLFGEILGAVVEFIAYTLIIVTFLLGILNIYWTWLFIIVCWGFSILLTMATSFLSLLTFNKYRKLRDLPIILLFSIVEQIGFRQFSVVCRTYATLCFFKDYLLKRYPAYPHSQAVKES